MAGPVNELERTHSYHINRNLKIESHDDATWVLTSAFIIFTMQSGFGLLESGSVRHKCEVNIMVKNVADVIFGGLTYWMVGFGFTFGEDEWSNPFCGSGKFFVHASRLDSGWVYSKFFFQASFATTATTIVSGAMAERTKVEAYIAFSLFNTFVFCFPAHWIWGSNGWLTRLGALDISGAGPVHVVGGVTGLVATMMLKPRYGRFASKYPPRMSSPTNVLLGLFMLWWGWFGFTCGSTFGMSGGKWNLAARSAVATLCASVGGGLVSMASSYIAQRRKFQVRTIANGILGSLVSITAMCALAEPWEALIIGSVGSLFAMGSASLLDRFHIDDPVGCIGVHGFAGMWGLLTTGLFAGGTGMGQADLLMRHSHYGLFKGGGFYLLGVQTLSLLSMTAWAIVTSFTFFKLIDCTIGMRTSIKHELLGPDIVEHGVGDIEYDKIKGQITNMEKYKEPSALELGFFLRHATSDMNEMEANDVWETYRELQTRHPGVINTAVHENKDVGLTSDSHSNASLSLAPSYPRSDVLHQFNRFVARYNDNHSDSCSSCQLHHFAARWNQNLPDDCGSVSQDDHKIDAWPKIDRDHSFELTRAEKHTRATYIGPMATYD